MRIAGTSVYLEIKMAAIGAKTAESWAHAKTRENIFVVCFLSASSIKRHVQQLAVIALVPFISAATRKNQKFSARHQIRAGIHQPIVSKMAVAFLLPILSVNGPLKNEKKICESVVIVTIKPTRVSVNPRASIYTDIYGIHRFIERPQRGSVYTHARGFPLSSFNVENNESFMSEQVFPVHCSTIINQIWRKFNYYTGIKLDKNNRFL